MAKLYQRFKGGSWYFKAVDSYGVRRQVCTRTADYDEAMEFFTKWDHRDKRSKDCPFGTLLELYKDPETNPKYKACRRDGRSYTLSFAKAVASQSGILEDLMRRRAPGYLRKEVGRYERKDVAKIKDLLIDTYGRCRKSQLLLQLVKVVFSQAADEGYIKESPAKGLPGIQYEAEKRQSLDTSEMSYLLSRTDLCDQDTADLLKVLALTGMRLGEALAIRRSRLDGNVYSLVEKQESAGKGQYSKPKMGKVRYIPLCPTVVRIIERRTSFSDLAFDFSNSNVGDRIRLFRKRLVEDGADPDVYGSFSAHICRHSANSNLMVAGVHHILVSGYLGWTPQGVSDIQRNYLHTKAAQLQIVADTLETLYVPKKERPLERTV